MSVGKVTLRSKSWWPIASLALASAASAACSALIGLDPPPTPDGEDAASGDDAARADGTTGSDAPPGADAPGTDAPGADAPGQDSSVPPLDAGSDAPVCALLDAGDGATVYSPFRQGTLDDAGTEAWQFFEPSSVNALAHDFQGGVYDGRYVYFAPSLNGTVVRYDTQAANHTFSMQSSWSTFDTSTLGVQAQGFSGAVYDGRYVYFVPSHAPSGYAGVVARLDSTLPFASATSWSIFDLTTLPGADAGNPLVGFAGGVYDGHAVYFVPYYDGVTRLSRIVRYVPAATGGGDAGADAASDAAAGDAASSDAGARDAGAASDAGAPVEAGLPPFAAASQFQIFDLSTRSASASGFFGGAFDGRYLYAVPYENGAGPSGILARYDTDGGFTTGAAWTTYDTTEISTVADGFTGAAFDGRYVYLVPHSKTTVARYDTTQSDSLGHVASWSVFDLASVYPAGDAGPPSFAGAAFDGRFVYFVPSASGGQSFSAVVRYDTWSTFGSLCAWSTFDVATLVASAVDFYGAVFDGQYLYLPSKGNWVARFQVKSPPSMPALPGFNGSFY